VTIQQAFQIALQHHQSGRLAEAEALYRQVLAAEPRNADALHLLGVVAHQVGQNDVALGLIRQALALLPDAPEFHSNLGEAYRALGQLDEAIAAYRQAIALRPDQPEANANLGNSLRDKGLLDEAIAAYRQAIALRPNLPKAHNNLGTGLQEKGQLDEAIAAYRQAVAFKSDYPQAHNNLGVALKDSGQLDEAITAYRQAIALKPDFSEAHCNLGNVLKDKGQLDEAIALYRRAITLQPSYAEAHSNVGLALKDKGQLDEAIAAFRQAIAFKPDLSEAHSNLVFTLHCHSGFDARAIAEEHDRWYQQHAEPLRQFIRPHLNDPTPDRRLRIGYVSPDFRMHSVGLFLRPLLAQHDHQSFEIFCYAQVPVPDDLTRQLHARADHWHSLVGLSDRQAADLIQRHQIDILVDLALHTTRSRLLIFARKPAPVQVTYLAYAGSSGLRTMDYRLSDPFLDPPEVEASAYSEQTFRLAQSYWCYQPMKSPPLAPVPAMKAGHITFGCLNNFCKVSEPALQTWVRLLQAVPGAQLLLHAPEGTHRQRTADLLQGMGIDPRRLRFVGRVPLSEYLQLYGQIDIALDPFPYGGGTTTCDALWMGVPVVSLAGKMAVGRGGLSILSNIGLPELVADSEEKYVRLALELAGDLPRLDNLRANLRDRMQASPLMDAPRFTRDIETAYRTLWQCWCREKKPSLP